APRNMASAGNLRLRVDAHHPPGEAPASSDEPGRGVDPVPEYDDGGPPQTVDRRDGDDVGVHDRGREPQHFLLSRSRLVSRRCGPAQPVYFGCATTRATMRLVGTVPVRERRLAADGLYRRDGRFGGRGSPDRPTGEAARGDDTGAAPRPGWLAEERAPERADDERAGDPPGRGAGDAGVFARGRRDGGGPPVARA